MDISVQVLKAPHLVGLVMASVPDDDASPGPGVPVPDV